MITIEVIYSYEHKEQEVARLKFPSSPSEAEALAYALEWLGADLAQLRKLSMCQIVENDEAPLPWLIDYDGANGKYYFGLAA